MREQFVSEAITSAPGTADASAMSRGEPGLPSRFTWSGREFHVACTLSTWKTTTPDRGELYLRRHWFAIKAARGERMTVYCERQAKRGKSPKRRWWLYSIGQDRCGRPLCADRVTAARKHLQRAAVFG